MASKKKHPSFEIPETVRQAGQAGWVYRSGKGAPTGQHASSRRTVTRIAARATNPPAAAPALATEAVAPPPSPSPTVTGRLVGLGLQVAAVPFVVPLFLTAAVSRRLGLTGPR